MRTFFKSVVAGKDTRINGVIALLFIAAVALGCTCGKDFDLSNIGKEDNGTSSPTSSPSPDEDIVGDILEAVEKPDATSSAVPTDAQLQIMTRTTILDFYDAVSREDFSTFRANTSKAFQRSATNEKFLEVFKPFIDIKPDFSEVRTLAATFDQPAEIGKESGYRTLKMKGRYDVSPRPLKFDLKYIPEGKDWKLIYIEVNTK